MPVLLEMEAGAVARGQQFEVRVTIGAGYGRPVDTAQVYLEFDPTRLQAESISPGRRLEYLLLSTWDNTLGNAQYAAGTLGPAAESPFMLYAVTFRATAEVGSVSTQIRFADRPNIHRTKVISRGLDVTGELTPLEVRLR